MNHPRLRRAVFVGAAAGAGLLATYLRLLRPWTMRWGATDEEVARPLPGDRLMARPGFKATRAITIAARPEHIWPWLVQLGSGRAGWYAIDRIDNAGVPSAQQIIPQLQHLQVGDRIPMIAGEEVGPLVKELEPNRRMLWWDGKGEFTWEWLLEPLDDRMTRLLTRVQETYPPLWSRRMLYAVVASSGDIVMVRKQLRGIKARAERLAAQPQPRTAGGIHPGPGALVKATRLLSHGGATVAAGLMAYGTGTAVAWARFPNREIVVGTNPQHPHPGSCHRR